MRAPWSARPFSRPLGVKADATTRGMVPRAPTALRKERIMKTTRINRQEQDRKILSGIDQYLAAVKTITIAGKDYVPGDLKPLFQADLDAAAASDAAKAAWKLAVVAERQARARVAFIRRALHAFVALTYGDPSQALADFGFPPKKTGVPTAETKAQALAKRSATRKARHIMGSRQRKKIVAPAPQPSPAPVAAADGGGPPAVTPPTAKA